jgi:hypothetical protein
MKDVASTMIANGMQAAGYEYGQPYLNLTCFHPFLLWASDCLLHPVNLDDCWANPTRDANGNIYGDPSRFPSGMKALADWLHSNGFKFGLYTSAGWTTCSTGNRVSVHQRTRDEGPLCGPVLPTSTMIPLSLRWFGDVQNVPSIPGSHGYYQVCLCLVMFEFHDVLHPSSLAVLGFRLHSKMLTRSRPGA